MGERSLAGRALLLLPFAGVAAWSANATMVRMSHDRRGVGPGRLEFVTGSMDDQIMDTLDTGDIVLFTRRLKAMQPWGALWTRVMRAKFNPRFDHCGVIYVDKLGRKFVIEETFGRVECRPYSARVLMSEADEIVVLPLKAQRSKELQQRMVQFVDDNVGRVSRISLRAFVAALIDPVSATTNTVAAEQDGSAPLFPAVALVAEAYGAMGLVDPSALTADGKISAQNATPRHWVARGKIRFLPGTGAKFGSSIPIRLY
ncbi:TPA: hypothetical protein N0F65_010813 [Lagenidium giganteum]|uniref:Uncharacterized protein n=1 Tax=Lagenidium giganteum TaxID=4803 RepID=A0AAV2Z4A8_9STRA|nr:TPA: hypothetical protein N0F65_010813 [Lagenidium giganteum]